MYSTWDQRNTSHDRGMCLLFRNCSLFSWERKLGQKSNERYTVISDYENGGELFVEPSSSVTIVLIVSSTISPLAFVVKVILFLLWSTMRHKRLLLDILLATVIIEPVVIAAKSGIIVTYFVAYRAMMLSASVKITSLEMIQLTTTISAVVLFACRELKVKSSGKLVDLPKESLAIVALWLCGTFMLYVTTIITTQTFVPDYRWA